MQSARSNNSSVLEGPIIDRRELIPKTEDRERTSRMNGT